MEIEEKNLLDLISWARRYCDGRGTYAPTSFNQVYESIRIRYPNLIEIDQFDFTLMEKGKYWPYAQDAMFNEETGAFDARRH